MRASRAVLARMDAAAMDRHRWSPLSNAVCGIPTSGRNSASISKCPGCSDRPANARAIAKRVAGKIPSASISSALANPTACESAWLFIFSAISSRCKGVNSLESRTPESFSSMSKSLGRITAAAATGPAHAPRPASSRPAVKWIFCRQRADSNSRLGAGGICAGSMRAVILSAAQLLADDEQVHGHTQ